MAISEKVELLGKGLYNDIPDELTLTALPTSSELEFISAEDYERVFIEKILPQCVEEKIDFGNLLEIDFQWVCRALRLLNYGPYFTTNTIFCDKCGEISHGEYSVNLMTIGCKQLPEKFENDIVIKKENFIDFNEDIHLKLPTIREMLNARKDKAFKMADSTQNIDLARICYMIKSIGHNTELTPFEIKLKVTQNLSAADYIILKEKVLELTDYGIRAGGLGQCPKCGNMEATFIALMDDKFFRPTLGDLWKWRDSRSTGKN
jgi:hypothetical protein